MKTAYLVVACAMAVSLGRADVSNETSRTLTVMSYNIHAGWGKRGEKWNLWLPIDVIRRAQPDVCGVQEIQWGGEVKGFQVDQPEIMGHILAPMWRFVKGKAMTRQGGVENGNCMFFKEQELSHVILPLPGEKEPRVCVAVEFADCWIATLHFSTTKAYRLKSVPILAEFARKQTKPVILTGDFNAHPDSSEMKELKKTFTILSNEKVFTCPTVKPDETIDYIAVDTAHSDRVSVVDSRVLTDEIEGSDHYPLLMRLKIAK